jgi:hypothetical protein
MSNRPRKLLRGAGHASARIVFMTLAAVVLSIPVEAVETEVCRIEVLVDGRPLIEYPARGTIYIEALEEREYAVRLTNYLDRRIAVALAVDGLNSIDAKTTSAAKASKWVLGPRETVTISGWQISTTDARRFFFTSEERSYGAWLGRTTNLGVIEAVVYREIAPRWVSGRSIAQPSGDVPGPAERGLPSAAPQSAETGTAGKAAADELAATGIGRRVDHRVQRVQLDLEDQPAARLRLRYEYRPQLVHLGVLPSAEEKRALTRREHASGFGDFDFAPDPFARGQ